MSLYTDGQINTTSVDGTSYTGLYAADGSFNIVSNTATTFVGLFHACGALNAVTVTDPSSAYYNANGSVNVIANTNSPSGLSLVHPPAPPGNFPSQVFDNFSRSDGALGTNWSTVTLTDYTGTLAISSDEVVATSSQHNIACWTSYTFSDDQFAEVSIPTVGAYGGPAVRCNARDGNSYACYIFPSGGGTNYWFFLWQNGLPTALNQGTFSASALQPTDVVNLSISGSTLTISLNGTPVATQTDTTLTSGSPGIAMYDSVARIDAFKAGPVVSGPPSPPPGGPGLYIGQFSNVVLNNSTALQIERTQPWSMVACVNLGVNPFAPTNGSIVFTNVANSPFTGYEVWLAPNGIGNNYIIRVKIIHDNNTNEMIQVSGTTPINDNKTHVIGVSYDGSSLASGVKVYIDGVSETTNPDLNGLDGTIVTGAGAMGIGNQLGNGFGLNGIMSFFAFTDIVQNSTYFSTHATRSTAPAVDANTTLYYDFSEGSGLTLHDQSTNGFNATVSGTGYAWY